MFRHAIARVAFAALAGLAPSLTAAQAYPTKTIRVVVPFTPGGFNDILGRMLAQRLQEAWGQPALVENKAGAGTTIGTEFAAKSASDGHTILVVALPFSVIPGLYPNARFDVLKDFAPVVMAGATPNVLVVAPSVPAQSVKELIALAKAKPGGFSYASAGAGSSPHLAMEMFKQMVGVDLVHIPYKGSAPGVTDMLAGQIPTLFDNLPNVIQHIRAGKMRALAVTTTQRTSMAPDVPTMIEAGVPGYEMTAWFGIVAPAGTPPDIIAKLNAEANKMLTAPDIRDRFTKAGVDPVGGTSADFGRHLQTEVVKWAKVVKDAGMKVE
ncbi:MAG: tripartite tricarboxylate transporter substrate binding protein [Burkholderiales bacterium]